MGKRRRSSILATPKPSKRAKKSKTLISDIQDILYHVDNQKLGQRAYLIKWPDTWEPVENLSSCDLVLARFESGDTTIYPENVTPFDFKVPGGTIFEIYKLLDKRTTQRGQLEYKVRWKSSWELEEDIDPYFLRKYHAADDTRPKLDVSTDDRSFDENSLSQTSQTDDNNANDDNGAASDYVEAGPSTSAMSPTKRRDPKRPQHKNSRMHIDEPQRINKKDTTGTGITLLNHVTSNGYKEDADDCKEFAEHDISGYHSRSGETDDESDDDANECYTIDRIVTISGQKNDISFIAKLNNGTYGVITNTVAKKEFPHKVIEYYESKVKFFNHRLV